MARNKYPEETYQLILEVSTKLFLEKGYDETSLQDIIDGLGGMTKGAIYHHFRSKEDILIAVAEHLSEENNSVAQDIRDNISLNGKEKIELIFSKLLSNPKQKQIFTVTPNLLQNPRLLAYQMKIVAYTIIPNYIIPVIREGVADGSITTDYPDELADVIMFLTDVWMNPLIFQLSDTQLTNRVLLINDLLKPYGIELIDHDTIEAMKECLKVTDQ